MISTKEKSADRQLSDREFEAQPLGSLLQRVLENRGLMPSGWHTEETDERPFDVSIGAARTARDEWLVA